MSRYRSYGKLDDPFTSEGDTFFLRMNARLRPNQLKPGEVALSKNGRMNKDGTWQTRKGLSTLFGSITSGADAIRLPYIITAAQRVSDVVTLTLNATPSLSFIPGNNITVADLGFTGDDPNGTFPLVDVNFTTKTVTYAEAGANENFTVRDETVANTSVLFPGDSIPTTLNFTLNDFGINEVFGSAVFSDPSQNSDDFIFIATDSTAIAIRLKDSTLFKCRYESGGESVDAPVGMLQGLGKMFIFRTNQTTLEATPSLQSVPIASASQSGQTITVNTSSAHNRVANDYVTLSGLGAASLAHDPNGCYRVLTTPSATQFTVSMTGSQTATFFVSGSTVEYFADFARVPSGDYTSPLFLTDTTANSANGLVTFDIPGANQNPANSSYHNISVGDTITIRAGSTPFDTFVDEKVRCVSSSNTQVTFNLGSVNGTASLTISKPLSVGKGFIHQPAAPWAVVHQRRLWMPYWYTSAAPPVDRNIRDEIVASDILDFNTMDQISNQFKPSSGQSDYLVALKPFTQDSIVAFFRKSIHLMSGVSGSLADVSTNLVTDEIGCSARKSVVQVANQILFLSDQGVYGIQFLDEFNLRGVEIPLSESIQPFIDRINQDYVHLSCGVYFDNRYWLATCLDSAPGVGNATTLNTILVYSFINQGWESIDTVNSTEFAIRELLVAKEGTKNALYLTTEEGGVHKVDGFEGGDVVSIQAGASSAQTIPVVSQITTRQYDADQLDRKMFSRGEIQIKSNLESPTDGDISFITEDPDAVSPTTVVSDLLGSTLAASEDSSIRLGIRKRGFGIQGDFKPTTGRPFVRAVKVDARIADRSTTSIK